MSKKRFFRALICFLLIGCLMFSYIALPSRATAVLAGVLTLEAVLAAMFSMAMGVVAVDLTVETWNKIGAHLDDTIITKVDTSMLESYQNLKAYWESIDPDGPEDPNEWKDKLQKVLSRGLLGAIASWVCGGILSGGLSAKSENASTGYAYYNDVYLMKPNTYDDLPFMALSVKGGTYYMYYSELPIVRFSEKYSYTYYSTSATCSYRSAYLLDSDSWSYSSLKSINPSSMINNPGDFLWSNYDFCDVGYNSGNITVLLSASEPSSTKTSIIQPAIYVGDLPQQIIDGEKDEDDIELPILDPFRLIQSPSTALQDINRVQSQLHNGTTTLDQYLEDVRFQDGTSQDPSDDPSAPTQPSTGTDTWEPPEDPSMFTLDLREIFPFCIPFDLYAFLACLNADPVTPVIQWELALPGGGSYPLEIDLSPFDSVAQLLRRLQLLIFIVGLAIKTRDLIKG